MCWSGSGTVGQSGSGTVGQWGRGTEGQSGSGTEWQWDRTVCSSRDPPEMRFLEAFSFRRSRSASYSNLFQACSSRPTLEDETNAVCRCTRKAYADVPEGRRERGKEGRRERGTEGERDRGTEGQSGRGTEWQRDSGTEGQRDCGTEGQSAKWKDGKRDRKFDI